jgi:CBS domain-containing protein
LRCDLVSGVDDTLLGLVTMHELEALARESWPTTAIRDVMVPLARLRSTGPDRPLLEALGLMHEGAVHQLPVLEGSALRSLVTREDLLRRLSVYLALGGEKAT